MTVNLTLLAVIALLLGTGTYLFLSSSVIRALLGFMLVGNGVNLIYLVAAGRPGRAPISGQGPEAISDPVPQAMSLTAIVITFASTAFVLALAHRAWQLIGSDHFDPDAESARLARKADEPDLEGPTAEDDTAEIAAEFIEEDRVARDDH